MALAQGSSNQTTPSGFKPICGDCERQTTLNLCVPNNCEENNLG